MELLDGRLDIDLDAQNNIMDARGYGVFDDFGAPPPQPPRRTVLPPDDDPVGAAHNVIVQMWSDTSGQPPGVRGQDLTRAVVTGRSCATR